MTDYALKPSTGEEKRTLASAVRTLAPHLAGERRSLAIAVGCVLVTTAANLLGPMMIARAIDTAIRPGDFGLLVKDAGLLALIYLAGLITNYGQTLSMGSVGRNLLFKLRNQLFTRLSELPIGFFAQNRQGDLISRVNSDTDRINQFFSQALMQFFGSFFVILGAGLLLLVLNWRLGIAALAPAAVVLTVSRLISPWIRARSRRSLESLGALSGDIQESLANFKAVVAFNRADYFRQKFDLANQKNFKASVAAGISAGVLAPLFTLAGSAAQILVLGFGVWLIGHHLLSVGLLIGYLLYVTSFYNPLRQLATVWSSLQQATAALDRVSEVLALENDLLQVPTAGSRNGAAVLAFERVGFSYPGGARVLDDVSFDLERGKTYALVGPTGGGKTTTAMLIARLYDPQAGGVYLDGRDIRTYSAAERAAKIGFILQEPFLFRGTVGDNIAYGHDELAGLAPEELMARLAAHGLAGFLGRFSEGLQTPTGGGGDSLSLGQKQLIAFMRAVLRQPEILILDEATANIDTVTEQLLEEVLQKLPATTTKVIIAHRLNTIQNADDIFFVGGGALTEAGSMDHALEMLLSARRAS